MAELTSFFVSHTRCVSYHSAVFAFARLDDEVTACISPFYPWSLQHLGWRIRTAYSVA